MAKGKKKPADKAEEEAPALARDDTSRMTWVERAARNHEVVELRARGLSWAQVSATTEVSVPQCKNIVNDWRASTPKLRDKDSLTIVDEMIEGYQADISELVTIGGTTKNDSVKVGAVNSRSMIRGRIIELLQAIGVLPKDLGRLQVEIDARFVARQIMVVLNKHEIPAEVRLELLQALRAGPNGEGPDELNELPLLEAPAV